MCRLLGLERGTAACASDAAVASAKHLFKPSLLAIVADAGCVLVVALTPIPMLEKISYIGTVWIFAIFIGALIMTPVLLSWFNPRRNADGSYSHRFVHPINIRPLLMVILNLASSIVVTKARFVVLGVALAVLSADVDDFLRIAHEPLEMAIIHSVTLVGWSTLWLACGLIIIAAVDVPVQLWEAHKKLLMTKQEVRDEHKDQEGRPEVKQRIRQLQREMSQRKMMASVPDADVVITNPTHYAVALKYDPEKGGAPMLLAKGSDFTALKIREIAVAHDILLLESPELARSIFYSTDLDQEIPAGLYLAVAQVLAYVYQIRQYRAGKGKRPDPLKDLPIPPELRRDS